MNTLYYEDNFQILGDYIKDESVELIYLAPPFNFQATYNILLKSLLVNLLKHKRKPLEDTWHWTEEVEKAFHEIINITPANLYSQSGNNVKYKKWSSSTNLFSQLNCRVKPSKKFSLNTMQYYKSFQIQ